MSVLEVGVSQPKDSKDEPAAAKWEGSTQKRYRDILSGLLSSFIWKSSKYPSLPWSCICRGLPYRPHYLSYPLLRLSRCMDVNVLGQMNNMECLME